MVDLTRRELHRRAAAALGFFGLQRALSGLARAEDSPLRASGYGPLRRHSGGILALPKGFDVTAFSRFGETMSDGLRVPGGHDGMAAFPAPDGQVLLIRNHELSAEHIGFGAFDTKPESSSDEGWKRVDRSRLYDVGADGENPCFGGTTTILYDPKARKVIKQFLSLGGTSLNCAGGLTPWGTWITCEESTWRKGDGIYRQDHGYPFEVPARADSGLIKPAPIKAMGRFRREAIAVGPVHGVVYQTEDRDDGLFTRYVPNKPGELAAGGLLEALAIKRRPGQDMKSWAKVGDTHEVEWIPLSEIDAPKDDLRVRARAAGAAVFSRPEGIWAGEKQIFFSATTGGARNSGQIWAYSPSSAEGQADEKAAPGSLTLFLEPNDPKVLDMPDNITAEPRGGLVLCEDGLEGNWLRGVTRSGQIYEIAQNIVSKGEFAGATFSPDGQILFVNIQSPGVTLAITGPWRAL